MMLPRSAVLLLLLPTSAFAADRPLAGVFYWQSMEGKAWVYDTAQSRLNCAWEFDIRQADGTYTSYILDKAIFDSTGKPSYKVWLAGKCDVQPNNSHEICQTLRTPANWGPSPKLGVVYDSLEPDILHVRVFNPPEAAAEAGQLKDQHNGEMMRANRCPFTADQVAPFLSNEATSLTQETWPGLAWPQVTSANMEHMRKVLAAIGVQSP